MNFTDEFLYGDKKVSNLSVRQYDWTIGQDNRERLRELQTAVKSTFDQGIDRLEQSQMEASVALQGELAYQSDLLRQQLAQGSSEVVGAIEHQTFEVVSSIQRLSDYLGGELCEVRWAIERHHQTSQAILRVLLDSLSNESKQYFEQGIRCYDNSEHEMAKERFNKALESDLTNYFAYQYLGFIGVADGQPDDAIRNFDLARKFANNNYHRALALSHLARSYQAIKDLSKAVELSNEAAKTHPDTAKFWYESAAYSARLRLGDLAVLSLEKAISKDRTYWAIVTVDSDFDLIRQDVVELQNTLREAAKNGARRAIDDFKRTLDTSRKVGASQEVADFAGKLDGIERSFRQNNFFVFLDLSSSVQDMREEIFKLSESKVASLLMNKQQDIVNDDKERQREIMEVEAPIKELEAEKGSLASRYEKSERDRESESKAAMQSCAVSGLMGLVFIVTLFTWGQQACSGIEQNHAARPNDFLFEGGTLLLLLSILIVPIIAALMVLLICVISVPIISALRYRAEVTIPQRNLENTISAKTRTATQSKIDIEEQFKQKKSHLEIEWSQLNNYLEKCKARQDV